MAEMLTARPIDIDGSAAAVNDYFEAQEWTDGLPIIPPTEDLVSAFIEAAGVPGEYEVAVVPPLDGRATVEKIAINAVMAGCRAEYMPVILAAVEAMCDERFNLGPVQATTNGAGVAVIINGPVRHQIKLNCSRNCLGPGTRSNATIGRAVRLIMLNLGGGRPEVVDKAVLGFPGKYTLCFGEIEEESPWDPLHVDRGFVREDSVVTVASVNSALNILTANLSDAEDKLAFLGDPLNVRGTNNVCVGSGETVVVITSGDAQVLASAGFSKADVQQYLYANSGIPEKEIPAKLERRQRIAAVTSNGIVRQVRRPEDIMIVVAGGPEPYHAMVMPTFGHSWSASARVRMDA